MKICMLSTGHNLFDDRIYYKEVLSLSKKYSHIFIVAPGEENDGIKEREQNGIRIIPLKKSESILQRLLIIPTAIKTVLKIKPQICHFHDFEFIFALPFLKLISRSKIIYDVHEVYPEMVDASKKIPNILRLFIVKFVDLSEKMLSRLADYIITSDNSIAERFKCNHHVSTVYNYPRLSLFVPERDRISHLKKLYEGRTPIIYQGGMSEDRGLLKMIQAMNLLKKKRPDIVLLLVGEMSDDIRMMAKEAIQMNDLHDNIDIIGWVPHRDVVNYITISKIGLVPLQPIKKYLKNIPIKQFEYMACGVPVLGSDLPPIASYINKSGSGKVYESTSAKALAGGILDILKDESGWKCMSEAGKKATQNKWNWDEMEKRLFAVYKDIIGY
jgi:glycosyltransferase involved in cell wall biosynthesis